MKVKIDNTTMLNITDEYFAPMKRVRDKREDSGFAWVEYKWFSRLEYCIKYLAQKRLSEKKDTVQLSEFLKLYKSTYDEIRSILTENNI